jgi:hypothetical protein
MKCIKIITIDGRTYYTDFKYIKIIEKIKILIKNYKIIENKNQKIINIKNIIKLICSHTLQEKTLNNTNLSKEIKNYIKSSFEKKKTLNFLDLKKKFSKYKNINLYNHLNQIKKIYKKNGIEIKRVKTGIFKLS